MIVEEEQKHNESKEKSRKRSTNEPVNFDRATFQFSIKDRIYKKKDHDKKDQQRKIVEQGQITWETLYFGGGASQGEVGIAHIDSWGWAPFLASIALKIN